MAVIDFNTQTVLDLTGDDIDSANHEVVTDNLEVGISIKNLTKIFGLVNISPYRPKNKPLFPFQRKQLELIFECTQWASNIISPV